MYDRSVELQKRHPIPKVYKLMQLMEPKSAPVGMMFFSIVMSLDIQTPGEDRCLNPQTSPEVRLLGVPFTPILTRYDWRIVDVEGVGCHT